MKTPAISLESQASKQVQFYDRSGQDRRLSLVGDGAVENEVAHLLPQESFLSSLSDPRLEDGEASVAKLGKGWAYRYDMAGALRLGQPEGPHQDLMTQQLPGGDRRVTLNSVIDGVEHRLSGEFKGGKLNPASVKEEVVLDASPAGLPVYCNGAVLFDLPSAFSGGCTW